MEGCKDCELNGDRNLPNLTMTWPAAAHQKGGGYRALALLPQIEILKTKIL